ncbi:hypothetical protein AaE_011656 [Aphanomyces astaci]|uniref:Cyclic nucleotide-binding domain-containing protein n=1 Tax=Aphanomyces astaci TaxID=112090 RepID=A0A6A4ZMW5_APHAT|nr:hypothetical protein AaE_011656 [Aphanomyces astaci]
MTTVGYGDLKPSKFSVPELSFAVVCLIVNSTVFAYVVSGIIGVISNHNPSDREYRTQMNEMKDYVRDTAMSVRLSNNVKRHYDFLLSTTCLFPEEQIFNQLRPSLRFDVARLVASNTIMTINIIASMEKKYKGFVSYALFLLRPQFILRSERVCRSGSPGTEMFFLIEGECEQMDQDNHNVRVLGSIADLSPAISVNLAYEFAKSILQDDFLTLNDEQEAVVLGAIERKKTLHPEGLNYGPLTNMAKVAMAKLRIVKGSVLPENVKEAMKGVMSKTKHTLGLASGAS